MSHDRGGESGIRTHGTEGRILGPSSDYLRRNDWLSCLIGALLRLLGRAEAPQGITPCRVVCSAGLRWCGGWRRTNLRGSHDQTQIEA
jgi:hypothetical protein